MFSFSQPLKGFNAQTKMLMGSLPAGTTRELFDECEWVDLDDILRTGTGEMIYARVSGFSMIDAGIKDGDLLIIELNDQPRSGEIVVANLNGETTVKRWNDVKKFRRRRHLRLVPANASLRPVTVKKTDELRIIGIVRHIIKSY